MTATDDAARAPGKARHETQKAPQARSTADKPSLGHARPPEGGKRRNGRSLSAAWQLCLIVELLLPLDPVFCDRACRRLAPPVSHGHSE